MDKYQKYILDKIEYANNFVFSHCQPIKNELDGSLERYGFFEKETDTFQITQDEDIHKTKYVLTVDTKQNVFNIFEKILVHRKEKWEEIPFAKGQYRIVVDFSKRIDAIRFDFTNQLADAYILKVTYIEADQEKYYAKLAQEKKKSAARKPAKKKPSGNDNPVKAGLRARKQAAEQQRKQRKQYFHDKAVAAAIERSRQQKEEQD
mgnify:CR=1 FL=1